jgi:hypothetical protein
MDTYSFSLVITQPTVDDETAADRLYSSGCDDSLFSISEGVYLVTFDRKARSLKKAISSAIDDVNKSKIGSRVIWLRTSNYIKDIG